MFRPANALSTVHEITALQYALEKQGRRPIVVVDAPVLPDGRRSDIPVVCNLTASRALVAKALGINDHRTAAPIYARKTGNPIAPKVVAAKDAPVQQIVSEGDTVDLTRLPALKQHSFDPGPYLTAAHATTYDPDTGTDNTAIQRCWIKGPRRMSYYPYPASHNNRNMRKFWARGEDCPVVFWIGHHPAVLMGTQAKLGYPESHWAACGGLIGEPLRLVPSRTFGDKIMVPADAEIVIEGTVPREVLEADGPFGEYTGYSGPQVAAPVCEVRCITMRANALYHDYGSGLTDMLVPDNMAMEGKVYQLCKAVAPALTNVYVPAQGRRFHAYLQLNKPGPGEARDALTAALSYRRLKLAIALDDDIDLFDDSEVLFALATRVQWSRDSFTIDGLSGSLLDPSTAAGAKTLSKMAIDATLPLPSSAGAPSPVPPRSTVPVAARAAAAKALAGADMSEWPTL
ncbi:MAG: UbiD family decarboxylase [Rhodospirillaceae bacterium]|nr:UbiD family decarboxylase [Rhodospirillaceae bacterium]